MSCCKKYGVSKTRMLTLAVLSLGIIVQAVSLALPLWSKIDTSFYSFIIKAHQGLWREYIIKDEVGIVFSKDASLRQNGWKKELQKVEVASLIAGLSSLVLLLLSSFAHKRPIISRICRLIGICLSIMSGISVLVGCLQYKTHHREVFSIPAKDPKNGYPTDKMELSYGFYLSVTAGIFYGFVAVFEIAVLLADHVKKKKKGEKTVTSTK